MHGLFPHVVRKGQYPNLLGRNWLNRLPVLLSNINGVHENSALTQVLRTHVAHFDELLQLTERLAWSLNPMPNLSDIALFLTQSPSKLIMSSIVSKTSHYRASTILGVGYDNRPSASSSPRWISSMRRIKCSNSIEYFLQLSDVLLTSDG